MGVTSWGDEDNALNEFSAAGIKWEDAPLAANLNVVTGKRLLFDAVGAGCFALEKYDQPNEQPATRKAFVSPFESAMSPEGREMKNNSVATESLRERDSASKRRKSASDFWRLNPIDYMGLLDAAYNTASR